MSISHNSELWLIDLHLNPANVARQPVVRVHFRQQIDEQDLSTSTVKMMYGNGQT